MKQVILSNLLQTSFLIGGRNNPCAVDAVVVCDNVVREFDISVPVNIFQRDA
ncbi:MAG: hypothetical protein M9926_00295 [Lentimicrobium sp.]|uniref:hypothetical protein n=1 Tax=Lentimicrobium sp. TaxID=2034841 RepID=UPI0025DFB56D|nr:hypothetical protein [Lentimicrobium sp.]MCO5255170.1 hypothetical protein [Lentimicrobium sp.]